MRIRVWIYAYTDSECALKMRIASIKTWTIVQVASGLSLRSQQNPVQTTKPRPCKKRVIHATRPAPATIHHAHARTHDTSPSSSALTNAPNARSRHPSPINISRLRRPEFPSKPGEARPAPARIHWPCTQAPCIHPDPNFAAPTPPPSRVHPKHRDQEHACFLPHATRGRSHVPSECIRCHMYMDPCGQFPIQLPS